jgi:hypothetical protein
MDTTTIIILVGTGLFMTAQQLRARQFGLRLVALPIAVAVALWYYFLKGAPTLANDPDLYLICGGIGAAIGLLGGALTGVRREPGTGALVVQGSVVYAGLFLALLGSRLAFAYLVQHGWRSQVVQFCIDHRITGQAPIVAALMLMIVATIVARVAVVLGRVAVVSARPTVAALASY